MRRTIRKAVWVLAACAASVSAGAGSISSEVTVNITLSSAVPPGLCSNVVRTDGASASVSVACATPQFVTITSSTQSAIAARGTWLGLTGPATGAGDAAFRSYSLDPGAERLEVLVTF